MRTKGEESSMASNARASNSPDIPSRTSSTLRPIQRSEIRWYLNTNWLTSYTKTLTGHLSLQDLGDLQQLHMIIHEIWADNEPYWDVNGLSGEALSNAEQEIMIFARRHEADGRYRDAEYLIRRANSDFHRTLKHMWSHLSKDVLPTMVAMYEKMGDYTAEEMCQEKLVKLLFLATSQEQVNEEQIGAVVALSRLLYNFHERVLDLVPNFGEIDLFITYRAAVLDVVLLNEVLLEQGLITPETKEKSPCTSLHIAAKENATNLTRQLIKMGADVNSEDESSCTPLHIAAQYAGPEMVELLLNNKAQVQGVDDFGNTPLHAAMIGKRLQNVAHLVNGEVDVNASYIAASTALRLAIRYNVPEIVPLLLEQGASVEATDHGEPPLFTAVRDQKTWAIEILLDNGASLLEKNGAESNVLELVLKMDREYRKPIVQVLLGRIEKTRSTSHEKYDYEGSLVLHHAIKTANVPMVEMLLEARGCIHAHDHGETALHQAIVEGGEPHERIVKMLLEYDAVGMLRVNLYGQTALHLAVTLSRRDMLVILLQHKPDELPALCQMRNHHGQKPLDIARAMARGKEESSVEISVLYLLENALNLVSATGLHRGIGEEAWNSDLV